MWRLIALLLLALTPATARAAEGALYRSDDAGKTWAQLESSPNVATVYAMLANLRQPGHLLLASDQSLWTTADDGATWSPRVLPDTPSEGEAVYALTADPFAPERVWAASERGVWSSQDGGETWRPAGPSTPRVVALIAERESGRLRLYGGGSDGLAVSNDDGASWRPDSAGIQGAIMAIAVTPEGSLLVGSTSGLFARADTESEFVFVRGLPRGGSRSIHVTADGTVYAAVGSNLYRRENGWIKMATLPLAPNGDSPGIAAILRVDDRLLLGTEHGLHSSDDWKPVPPFDQLAYLEAGAIEADPFQPDVVYLGVSVVPNAIGYGRVGVQPNSATIETPDEWLTMALIAVFVVGGVFVVFYARRMAGKQVPTPYDQEEQPDPDEEPPPPVG